MKKSQKVLKDLKIDIKFKLSALWIIYMFVFIYTDYYKLFMPGVINDLISGIMEGVRLTQISVLIFSIITIIPALMIFLSLVLKAKINRWLNIIVGLIYIVIGINCLIAHFWGFWIFYCILLTLAAVLIVIFSWKWPSDN